MSRTARLLTLATVVVVVVVVVVVLLTGGGGDDGKTVRGDAGRGFPLRGSLADDSDAIGAAVQAWRDAGGLGAPSSDEDVEVLWIGATGADKLAILAAGHRLAEVFSDFGDWKLSAVATDVSERDPGDPIGVGRSVLVPEGVHWSYRSTTGRSTPAAVDGLFHDARSGFVLPATDDVPEDGIGVLYGIDIGRIGADRATVSAAYELIDGGSAAALWNALRAAGAQLDTLSAPSAESLRYLHIPAGQPATNGSVAVSLERPPAKRVRCQARDDQVTCTATGLT